MLAHAPASHRLRILGARPVRVVLPPTIAKANPFLRDRPYQKRASTALWVEPPAPRAITKASLIAAVATAFDVPAERLTAKGMRRPIAWARFALVRLMRDQLEWSYPQIARNVGFRDHTTVMHALRRAGELFQQDADWRWHFDIAQMRLGLSSETAL